MSDSLLIALAVLGSSLLLGACDDAYYQPALYREAFRECMATLPEGPRTTTFNDWDEVTASCQNYAHQVVQRTPVPRARAAQ